MLFLCVALAAAAILSLPPAGISRGSQRPEAAGSSLRPAAAGFVHLRKFDAESGMMFTYNGVLAIPSWPLNTNHPKSWLLPVFTAPLILDIVQALELPQETVLGDVSEHRASCHLINLLSWGLFSSHLATLVQNLWLIGISLCLTRRISSRFF